MTVSTAFVHFVVCDNLSIIILFTFHNFYLSIPLKTPKKKPNRLSPFGFSNQLHTIKIINHLLFPDGAFHMHCTQSQKESALKAG